VGVWYYWIKCVGVPDYDERSDIRTYHLASQKSRCNLAQTNRLMTAIANQIASQMEMQTLFEAVFAKFRRGYIDPLKNSPVCPTSINKEGIITSCNQTEATR